MGISPGKNYSNHKITVIKMYHKRCERVWCHPDDVGYVAEAEEDSDETQGDDDDEEEEEQKVINEVIVLNSIELGAPTISRKRFCKQYRTTYQQIIPDEKNEAYSFAKKEFRKIRNTFDGVNDIALKLFKDFADINKNKYQNLDEIDTLRQSMNRKRDRYKDTEGGGDDKEDSLKEDSDDSIKALPVEPIRRKVGRPKEDRKNREMKNHRKRSQNKEDQLRIQQWNTTTIKK
ncbi:unnamed protein product [Caenorhabditis nigoni]